MSQPKFPPGWDEERVREVLAHYENQGPDGVRPGLGISKVSLKPLKRSPFTPDPDSSRCVALPQH